MGDLWRRSPSRRYTLGIAWAISRDRPAAVTLGSLGRSLEIAQPSLHAGDRLGDLWRSPSRRYALGIGDRPAAVTLGIAWAISRDRPEKRHYLPKMGQKGTCPLICPLKSPPRTRRLSTQWCGPPASPSARRAARTRAHAATRTSTSSAPTPSLTAGALALPLASLVLLQSYSPTSTSVSMALQVGENTNAGVKTLDVASSSDVVHESRAHDKCARRHAPTPRHLLRPRSTVRL